MLLPISGTQYACYLSDVSWEALSAWAYTWLAGTGETIQHEDPTLILQNAKGRLHVERYALMSEKLPWSYLLTWTEARESGPLDAWWQLRWAEQVALHLQTEVFVDVPTTLFQGSPAFYWQIRLSPVMGEIRSELAKLEEVNEAHIRLLEATPLNLKQVEPYASME